jgi:hypothetical protein
LPVFAGGAGEHELLLAHFDGGQFELAAVPFGGAVVAHPAQLRRLPLVLLRGFAGNGLLQRRVELVVEQVFDFLRVDFKQTG